MRTSVIIFLILITCPLVNYGQISYADKPSFYHDLKTEIPIYILPSVDRKKLEREDQNNASRIKNIRYAEVIEVDISPSTHGIWNHLQNESIWYLTLHSSGAFSLGLVFDHYRLPKGAQLFIYSSDKNHVRGAFTYKNNKLSNSLPIAPVKGEEIIIEYHEPKGVDFKGELHISSVAHDYKNIFNLLSGRGKGFGDSGDCNINVNCDEDELWQLIKQSVCKITYNGYLCSGALVNNTKTDGYPYLLTANHCIGIPSEAQNAIFYFNYESPDCLNTDGNKDQTIASSSIVATPPERTVDFSLLELSEKPPPYYKPYFAGWNRDISNPESVTSIHHPRGDVKKITKSYDGAVTGDYGEGYNEYTHWWIDEWDEGTTEGGSSGSPLFDQNGRIIGDLTGGDANCSYNFNDFYQKLYHSWNDFSDSAYHLKPWLDPLSSGVVYLDGYLPYDSIPSNLRASLQDTVASLSWNHVTDTADIAFYYLYRNSVIIDSLKIPEYTDTLSLNGAVYNYFVTAKYHTPLDYESDPSNVIYVQPLKADTLPIVETFEDGFIPENWYEERTNDTVGWQFKNGGFETILDTAFEGSFDAFFYGENGESSKLVLPKFDFSSYPNLVLTFYLHMQEFNNDVHQLRILYKETDSLDWKILRVYDTSIMKWEKKKVSLHNLSSNYRIAFEGIGLRGYGICIDSITIYEDTKYLSPSVLVDKSNICIYDSVEFSTTLDNSYDLKWNFGSSAIPSSASGEGPHWVKYSSHGIKTVELMVNDTYLTQDYEVLVVYEEPITPSFTNIGNTLISSADFGNQWYLNDVPIVGATDTLYVIEEDGNYYVEVSNSFNCSVASEGKFMIVNDLEPTEGIDKINELIIYPNPNNGWFNVECNLFESGSYQYEIYNVTGKLMQSGVLEERQTQNIHFRHSEIGLYFIKIFSSETYYTSKILIKK